MEDKETQPSESQSNGISPIKLPGRDGLTMLFRKPLISPPKPPLPRLDPRSGKLIAPDVKESLYIETEAAMNKSSDRKAKRVLEKFKKQGIINSPVDPVDSTK